MNDKNNNNYLNYGLALGLIVALGLGVGALVVATEKDDKSKSTADYFGKAYGIKFFLQSHGDGVVQGDGNDAGFTDLGKVDKDDIPLTRPKDSDNLFAPVSSEVEKLPKIADLQDDTSRFGSLKKIGSVEETLKFVASSANKFIETADISTDLTTARDFSRVPGSKIKLEFTLNGQSRDFDDISVNREQKFSYTIDKLGTLYSKLAGKLGIAPVNTDITDYFKAYDLADFIDDNKDTADKNAKAFGFESKKDFDKYRVFAFDLDRAKDVYNVIETGKNAQPTPGDLATALSETNLILAINKETGDIKVAHRLLASDAKDDDNTKEIDEGTETAFNINTVKEVPKVGDNPKIPAHADFVLTYEGSLN